jgi:undecaprenyl-phosphate 4-deoxy-4-formamido-L-arabinose transferase
MELSVIIPVYNSEKTIGELVLELNRALSGVQFEVILVNDGSRDGSEAICKDLATKFDHVTFISLRRNYGEHNAVMCGLNHASGDYAVIIDDDFQNPPEEIIKLLREIRKGYDVVYSRYKVKEHNLLRNLGSKFNDLIANFLLEKPRNIYLSSFKILNADIVKEITKYRGPFPYVDGLILRVTDNITSVDVIHSRRRAGKSNYNLKRLVLLYLNMFVNFSIMPLRIFTFTGVVIFVLGIFLSIFILIRKFLDPDFPAGWTSLALAIVTLAGFQIIFLGLLGEYLGKQYLDQNNTPQWTIKKIVKKKRVEG